MTNIEKLLIELLKIESVSGNEKNVADFIVSKLKGFDIKKQIIEKDRYNIIAKKGESDVFVVAHMDTVPGVVPIKITNDKIYGRGSCDNKGNIAGMILLGNKLENINLLFTVGEEVDFVGVEKVKIKGARVIVMEPTQLKTMIGQMGIIAFSVITKGKEQHTSLKFKQEDSAVHELVKLINFLSGKRFNAFNVGKIGGGIADNVVAGEAIADISMRPKNQKEYNEILKTIKNLSNKFSCGIKIRHKYKPFVSSLPIKGEVAPFFSEMSFFKNSLLFGAGSIKQAHTNDEFISIKQLNLLEEKLEKLIQ